MDIKIISINKTETDWSVLYSVDGQQAKALTFPFGEELSNDDILEGILRVEVQPPNTEETL